MPKFHPKLSVVVCTLNRPRELAECIQSLRAQEGVAYEIIQITDRGPLAALRNKGWRAARGEYVAFLDDDAVAAPGWMSSVCRALQRDDVVGISGPSPIPEGLRQNRDIYRYKRIRVIYDYYFSGEESRPGHLTRAGTFVPDPDWSYQGSVQFLEACNMSFKKAALKAVGGFDEAFAGVGDWSEPDLCFRLRQRYGPDSLRFDSTCAVEHRPSKAGAYLLRRPDRRQRLANYRLFATRWVKPNFRHTLYQGFLWSYYTLWQLISR